MHSSIDTKHASHLNSSSRKNFFQFYRFHPVVETSGNVEKLKTALTRKARERKTLNNKQAHAKLR